MQNNYSRWLFLKALHHRCLRFWICLWFWLAQDSDYVSGSECARVLEIPGFYICLWIWICKDSEYTRVLNTGFRICINISWLFLNMPDFVCIYLNMPKHAWICLKLRECFCFIFSLWLHYITRGYLFEGLQETKFEFAATFRSRGEGGSWCTFLVFFFLSQNFWRNRVKFISYL